MTSRSDSGLPARVYLTGFMGSGKSTVAPILARLLGYECVDIDAVIERSAGKTVAEIFAEDGEAAFRRMERNALFATAERRSIVVAAGGGAIADEASSAFALSAGVLVYLRVDVETLAGRLRTMRDRPMLDGTAGAEEGDVDESLRATVRRLLSQREPFYLRAGIVVDTGASPPAAAAARIAGALRGLARRDRGDLT